MVAIAIIAPKTQANSRSRTLTPPHPSPYSADDVADAPPSTAQPPNACTPPSSRYPHAPTTSAPSANQPPPPPCASHNYAVTYADSPPSHRQPPSPPPPPRPGSTPLRGSTQTSSAPFRRHPAAPAAAAP